jgi:hypothetical protein
MSKLLKIILGVLSFALAGAVAVGLLPPKRRPRRGWEKQFKLMAERGDDELIELPGSSWDRDEWVWK